VQKVEFTEASMIIIPKTIKY